MAVAFPVGGRVAQHLAFGAAVRVLVGVIYEEAFFDIMPFGLLGRQ